MSSYPLPNNLTIKLSEECRVDRSLSHTYDNLLFQSAGAADSSRQHTRLRQLSHRQMKLSSVLRLLLIILRRRTQQVGGVVLSCVWFSSEIGCTEKNAGSSSWESAVLCCGIGFISERSPHHTVQDYGSDRARHG